jgi:hypothetical protein
MSVGRRPRAGPQDGEIEQCQGRWDRIRKGAMIPGLYNWPKKIHGVKA